MEHPKNRVITEESDNVKLVEAQRLQREAELKDLRLILETPEGVRFFKRFFDEAKMFQTCFTGNSTTYHNEGRRDLGLKFFSDCVEACPEKISELILRREL